MKKTPFWKIFKSIIENKVTSAHCRKSNKMIIRIINAYDRDTGGFKLGGKTIRITWDDIFSIFGITGGFEKASFKYGSRDGVEMVRRGSIEAERLSSSSLKELVKEYAVRNKAGRQDFVRLLCVYLLHSLFFPAGTTVKWVYLERLEDVVRIRNYDWCGAILDELMMSIKQHHDDPRRVSRCVMVLLYWLCKHTNLVKPLHPEESLGIIKWRTVDLVKVFREIALNELESNQVVSRQPNVDTNMVSGNIDNGNAGMSKEKIVNEGGNGSAEYGNGTECGLEKGPFKPKPIRNLRTNAVHRLLSSEEKAKIKKMWDEAYTSTIIWSGTIVGCSVFVEDIQQLIVDSAISENVSD
ncbi:hypothetical protein RHMOL_Rhmol11G0050900 [Rhododendron molle]|uniref:Uncharacterized protein n=1 Tax=Rhododendron molle TaxID=49168 RepID=A0ACC0LNP8_RHOML|nr:hypothetical protein RHMOL_Rhmol11G0050900 [Rhododendron molle]